MSSIARTHTAVAAVLLVLGALTGRALAEWAGPLPLIGVRPDQNGCALVEVPGGNFNPAGVLVIDPTQPNAKGLLAVATAGVLAGKSAMLGRDQLPAGSPCLPLWAISDRVTQIELLK